MNPHGDTKDHNGMGSSLQHVPATAALCSRGSSEGGMRNFFHRSDQGHEGSSIVSRLKLFFLGSTDRVLLEGDNRCL